MTTGVMTIEEAIALLGLPAHASNEEADRAFDAEAARLEQRLYVEWDDERRDATAGRLRLLVAAFDLLGAAGRRSDIAPSLDDALLAFGLGAAPTPPEVHARATASCAALEAQLVVAPDQLAAQVHTQLRHARAAYDVLRSAMLRGLGTGLPAGGECPVHHAPLLHGAVKVLDASSVSFDPAYEMIWVRHFPRANSSVWGEGITDPHPVEYCAACREAEAAWSDGPGSWWEKLQAMAAE